MMQIFYVFIRSIIKKLRDNVREKFSKKFCLGWYGAMCQGQAISVLCRAYHVTKDKKYLVAAEAALGPFQRSVSEGGVQTLFMDKYDWYEEYPTNPSTFILNGFMYSLIGLYDLKIISPHNTAVQLLFNKLVLCFFYMFK